ncbi:MAG: 50S ribosomal protein L24 [Candidatus Uhrbacteria bacterium GW2011_GWA2_53_10]|uniref:Large ribosomal subunit protein uL24 n=1 Tax=Candidatus Uhrbacteria bacterium GW2011_GWA2_53_10 TaxID=1618980 RepID=A0A0G1XQ05_9BACT|nr:MAG: 50S ribosomal protein L24 [Candidatus Uhrbacteria bacterium GW2011_GWA2_53_10]
MKIKTGDKVRVITGKEKGKEGAVLQVFPQLERVVVEGINLSTRHLRARSKDAPGQKIRFPAPIHISNVSLISAKSGKSGRVGYKIIEKDGVRTKIRVLRSKGTSEDIE